MIDNDPEEYAPPEDEQQNMILNILLHLLIEHKGPVVLTRNAFQNNHNSRINIDSVYSDDGELNKVIVQVIPNPIPTEIDRLINEMTDDS